MIEETDFLAQLRKKQDVSIYQFNDDLKTDRAVTLNKLAEPDADKNSAGTKPPDEIKTNDGEKESANPETPPGLGKNPCSFRHGNPAGASHAGFDPEGTRLDAGGNRAV